MYEQRNTGWGRLAFLLFLVGFTGSVSIWQGGFAAWFLFLGSVTVLLPACMVQLAPLLLEGTRQLAPESGRAAGGAAANRDVAICAGEPVQVLWQLRIACKLPLPWLTLAEKWRDANGAEVYQANKLIFPWFRRSITWSYPLPEWGRGVYASQGLQVTTGDLPGIVLRGCRLAAAQRVLVWPHRHALSRGELGEPAAAAVRNVAAVPEDAEPSAERRPYRPGDSLRSIDWRASARTSSWLVREREWVSPKRVWIMVDVERSAYAHALGPAQFEAALEIAASLLYTWDSKMLEAVLVTGESGEPLFAAGGAARTRAMDQLAEAGANGRRPFHQRLTGLLEWIRPEDRVIAIAPRIDEPLQRSASMVKQAAGQLQLWIPQCGSRPALRSRWEERSGRIEGLDVVRCLSSRADDSLREQAARAADEAGGIARA